MTKKQKQKLNYYFNVFPEIKIKCLSSATLISEKIGRLVERLCSFFIRVFSQQDKASAYAFYNQTIYSN